jgi:hypothetical protein
MRRSRFVEQTFEDLVVGSSIKVNKRIGTVIDVAAIPEVVSILVRWDDTHAVSKGTAHPRWPILINQTKG